MGLPPAGDAPAWVLVLPVKRLDRAKTRLSAVAGALRPDLAAAMALDTAEAVLACPAVAGLVAVTADHSLRTSLEALGADTVPDGAGAGINAALRSGARVGAARFPQVRLAALPADLPALRPEELARALQASLPYDAAFLPDAECRGTTLLLAASVEHFQPAYGRASRSAHSGRGAHELPLAGVASLRRDVDTGADLRAARGLGLGPRTRAVAALLGPLGHDQAAPG